MLLKPVRPQGALSLRDKDANAPHGLPDEKEIERRTANLLERLADLQNVFYADGRHALLVILQGRDAGGKDGTVRKVFGACGPLGCEVTSFKAPTPLELSHDFLWRIHQAVPAHGMIGLFNRSHYEDVLVVRVRNLVPRSVWTARYDQINEFERTLTANRVVVLKFFLHISREEQRERLLDRLHDEHKNWKFRAGDLDDRAAWDDYTEAYRDALRKCSTKWAPWYVVPADDKKVRNYLIADAVVRTLERLKPHYPEVQKNVRRFEKMLKGEEDRD
jgi:PPK2 family polyphosphate:nucleotide phosphotransferase